MTKYKIGNSGFTPYYMITEKELLWVNTIKNFYFFKFPIWRNTLIDIIEDETILPLTQKQIKNIKHTKIKCVWTYNIFQNEKATPKWVRAFIDKQKENNENAEV